MSEACPNQTGGASVAGNSEHDSDHSSDTAAAAAARVLLLQPCPSWCTVGRDHTWDVAGQYVRAHSRDVGQGLMIAATTEAVLLGGPEVILDAGILLTELPEVVDARQARAIAGALQRAAVVLEGLGLGDAATEAGGAGAVMGQGGRL